MVLLGSQVLQKVLTKPSVIASALDWKKLNGMVLTLNIHANRISAAVASHPSSSTSSITTSTTNSDVSTTTTTTELSTRRTKKMTSTSTITSLPDLPLGKHATVPLETKEQLQTWIKDHRICGIIVGWPLQTDTGKMGASCGRVLYTLDQLLLATTTSTPSSSSTTSSRTTTTSTLLSPLAHPQRRPLCLWDAGDHSHTPPPADSWGRSPAFAGHLESTSTSPTISIHRASIEQYHTDELSTTIQIWDHFCKAHWPEFYDDEREREQEPQQLVTSPQENYSRSTRNLITMKTPINKDTTTKNREEEGRWNNDDNHHHHHHHTDRRLSGSLLVAS